MLTTANLTVSQPLAQFRNKDRIKIYTETVQWSVTRTNQITSESAQHRYSITPPAAAPEH